MINKRILNIVFRRKYVMSQFNAVYCLRQNVKTQNFHSIKHSQSQTFQIDLGDELTTKKLLEELILIARRKKFKT